MSGHFQLLDFLRRAPKTLLLDYCHRLDILREFDWRPGKHVDADKLADALSACGDQIFHRVAGDFHALWDLEGRGFTNGLINEAGFHQDGAAIERLKAHSHLDNALWALLERQSWVANAKILSDVDKLPSGAWLKRGGMPARPGTFHQGVIANLQQELISFYSVGQHRGRHCRIDCLRRGDEEIFFAYAEDHPESNLFWSDGRLEPQLLSPSFPLIFKHNDVRRTLEVYVEGDRGIVGDLQQIFARSVLGDEISREAPDDEMIYDLDRLLEPGFQFQHSAELGIADVRVTKMRYYLEGEPWRRFMAEADAFKAPGALDQFIADLTERLPKSRMVLDQACINVRFHKRDGDRKSPSRTFFITAPNTIRLTKDELGERIAQMLLQSEIERRVAGDAP